MGALAPWAVPGLPALAALSWYVGWWTRLPFLGALFGVLTLAAVLDAALRPPTTVAEARADAAAERAVARELAKLRRRDFVLLHDRVAPASGSHVPHLAIGPCGAVVISARNWAGREPNAQVSGGKLWLGNVPQSEVVAAALAIADRVGHALGEALHAGAAIDVSAVLVIEGIAVSGAGRSAEGTPVLRADQVARYLTMRPRLWPPERVREVAAAAARALPPRPTS